MSSERAPDSAALAHTYDRAYLLGDCGGYQDFLAHGGRLLVDQRLQVVARLAELRGLPARVIDLGCGRGELAYHFARSGSWVLAIDYSADAIDLVRGIVADEPETAANLQLALGSVTQVPLPREADVAIAADVVEHLAAHEVEQLFARVAACLAAQGLFVLHTFPNLWHYRYGYARRRARAAAAGQCLPADPRSPYERLMHINEQSPRVLRAGLRQHFAHVLLWVADPALPIGSLQASGARLWRDSPSIYALASHAPIDPHRVAGLFDQPRDDGFDGAGLRMRLLGGPRQVTRGMEALWQVAIDNRSAARFSSAPPYPVKLSYHWSTAAGEVIEFDGLRSPLTPGIHPQSRARVPLRVRAPDMPGEFVLQASLVQEGVRWFDDLPHPVGDAVLVSVR
jgi:SAM-dependent methyltransferase